MHLRYRSLPFVVGCCLTIVWLSGQLFRGDANSQPATPSTAPLELSGSPSHDGNRPCTAGKRLALLRPASRSP